MLLTVCPLPIVKNVISDVSLPAHSFCEKSLCCQETMFANSWSRTNSFFATIIFFQKAEEDDQGCISKIDKDNVNNEIVPPRKTAEQG